MRRAQEVRIAGTLVVLTGVQQALNDRFGVDVVLTEIRGGVGAIHLFRHGFHVDRSMNAVQIIIGPDRTDLGRINGVVASAAVTDTDLAGQLLVQIHPIKAVHILHDVEIGDVNDVIAVDLGADVHGDGIGGTAEQAQSAGVSLLSTLGVAFSAAVGDVTNIGLAGADAADGALVNLRQHLADPALVGGQQFGSAGLDILILREQLGDIGDVVGSGMLELIILLVFGDIRLHGSFQGPAAVGLGHLDDLAAIGMGQERAFLVFGFLIEDITLHFGFLIGTVFDLGILFLGFVGRIITGIGDVVDNIGDGIFLFLGQRVQHVADGLFIVFLVIFLVIIGLGFALVLLTVVIGMLHLGFGLLFLRRIRMLNLGKQLDGIAGVDNALLPILGRGAVGMHDHRIDIGAGVGIGVDQTNLTDHTVQHGLRLLLQLVGVDGQSVDVTVKHKLLGVDAAVRVVEIAFNAHTAVLAVQNTITKNGIRSGMVVVPYDWNLCAILMGERILGDQAAVRTAHVCPGRPTCEIILLFHFDHSPYLC